MFFNESVKTKIQVGPNLLVEISERWDFSMLNFTWSVFSQTGNIDTYLLYKELEREMEETPDKDFNELAQLDFPIA